MLIPSFFSFNRFTYPSYKKKGGEHTFLYLYTYTQSFWSFIKFQQQSYPNTIFIEIPNEKQS